MSKDKTEKELKAPKQKKHKLFEHKVNLKKEDFSDRIITITGVQGQGKTSFVVDFIRELYKRQNKRRIKETNSFIDSLNSTIENGIPCYNLSKSPQGHYIYTAKPFSFILDKKGRVVTNSIDPERLGLPNNTGGFDHIPYGSIIIVDEADQIWPNRGWRNTPKETIELLKYVRHNHITLILLCQVMSNLDLKFREFTMMHFHFYSREIKPKRWFFKEKFIWHFLVTYPQELLMVKALRDLGVESFKPTVQYWKYISKENPHKYYTSRSGLPLFLRGISDYFYEQGPIGNALDRVNVNSYCAFKEKNREYDELENELEFWKFIEKREKLKDLRAKYGASAEQYLKSKENNIE